MISIVVVGYNSKKYLKNCFDSIYKSTYKDYRIIYVDNASSDGSLDFLQKNYSEVVIILLDSNQGYAGGNNLGIAKAFELGTDYIFLLNPDTIISEDCLEKLIGSINKKTILQPLILLHKKNKTHLVNTSGNYLNYLGMSYCNNYLESENLVKNGPIVSASGAAMFLPVEVLKRIGGFDEDFFMYHEDLDLCWRARKAGFEIKLLTEAKVWHKYSFSRNDLKLFYIERNRQQFLLKNFSFKTLFLFLPSLLVYQIAVIIYSIIDGWFLLKVKGDMQIWFNLRKILQKRRGIETIKNDRKLKIFLSAEINFSGLKVPFIKYYNFFNRIYWHCIYGLI
jgi:GT2 family glycosyltransferase